MKFIVLTFLLLSAVIPNAKAATQLLDSVSVIVDQGVVLESQIQELVSGV